MTNKDLFVIIYSCVWGILITLFVMTCWSTNCLTMSDAVLISNVAFLGVTSLMVFVKPIREFVNRNIIARL